MTKPCHPTEWKCFRAVHESEVSDFTPVPGTDGYYRLSKSAVIVTRRHCCLSNWPNWWIFMKPRNSRGSVNAFNRVLIYYSNGNRRHMQMSRLMLLTHIGDPPTSAHVAAHLNGNTEDDRLENLKWALPVDVASGKIFRGTQLRGEQCGRAAFTDHQVAAIKKILAAGVSGNCLARAMGVPQPRISEIARGITRNDSRHEGTVCTLNGEIIRARK